ncbi:MAG: helix-turn-helix domain-containing protein [Prevotella sp.]|nr:helix-turn-helix domain-containing protein [Prevotella sp.]
MQRYPSFLILLLYIWLGYGEASAKPKATTYSVIDGLSHDRIQGFYQASDGMIWICTWYGIDRFDGYSFTTFRPSKELNAESRFKEAIAVNDSLIIKTLNGKVLSFDLKTCVFDVYNGTPKKGSVRLRRKYTDRDGNLWSTTSSGVELIPNLPNNYYIISNPSYPYARAIYEDSQGHIWVGWCGETRKGPVGGEVAVYDLNGNLVKTVIKGKAVYSIFEDDKHNMWLGTRDNGLVILKPGKQSKYEQLNYHADHKHGSLSNNFIYNIVQDERGRIWIATLGGGVNVVESGYNVSSLSFLIPKGYPVDSYPRARSLLVNGQCLLVGTDTGLLTTELVRPTANMVFRPARYNGQHPAEEIIHLTEGYDKTVLISSFGKGIHQYECKSGNTSLLVAGDVADKQPVFAVLPDGKDKLWVTTRSGIRLYTFTDGGNSFITPVNYQFISLETKPLRDSKGQCWFASSDGLLRVVLPKMTATDSRRKVIFTDITYFKNDTTQNRTLTRADSVITVDADIRDISLGVSSMPFGNPDGVKYVWRIARQDTVWTEIDGKHSLTLTQLRPGMITLEVRSTDTYGRYLNNIGRISIDVKPHWYEIYAVKVAAYTIGCVLLLLWLLLIIRYRRLHRIYYAAINSQPIVMVSSAMTEIKPEESLTDADRDFINALDSNIKTMIDNPDFSIDSIVMAMGMSRSVFYRRLKAVVGQSPSEYINEYRLQRASEMLRDNPSRSVSEIAYACGFSSPQYFSNVFRKRYHTTPNEWRKQLLT